MNIKSRLAKLEATAAARAPQAQAIPANVLESYQHFYPTCQMIIDPRFKFKRAGRLTLTDTYDFFAAIIG